MGNNLEFILKLTDQFSTAMQAAKNVSENACTRIVNEISKANQSSRTMSASVNDLHKELERVNKTRFGTRLRSEFNDPTRDARNLERQIEKLESRGQKSGSSGGGILGSIVGGNIITSAIGAIGSAAMAGGRAIIGGASKQDANIAGLTTFLGASGAKEAYGNIKKDAATTPFDTEGLLMVNRSLISAGLSAKDARRDTMNLANAVSAVGGGNDQLSRMAENMQQIKTVGKATAMDIRQFGFAGINIYKILADATGKSIDQVKNMDVSYDLLSKSLQRAGEKGGAYFGAMAAQSKTIPGLWSNVMDNIDNRAADIGTALKPVMTWFINIAISVTDSISKIMPYLQPVIDVLNGIPGLIDSFNSPSSQWHSYLVTIKGVLNAAWETIKSVAGNIWHIVSGVVAWIGKSEMMKDLFKVIGDFAQFIWFAIQQAGNAISWIWDHILKPILDSIEWAYKTVKGLLGVKTEVQLNQTIKTIAPSGLTIPSGATNPLDLNGDRSSKITDKDLKGGGSEKTGKSRADGINSGGQRSIVINIGKQIEKLEVHVMGGMEAGAQIEAVVKEAMKRVFYATNDLVV